MKPHTSIDNLFAATLIQQPKPRPLPWDLVVLWLLYMLIVGILLSSAIDAPCETTDDYTDTGVGCVEDCLEPTDVEQPTAIIWEA